MSTVCSRACSFREVINHLHQRRAALGQQHSACGHGRCPAYLYQATRLDEVRRMMLERHARYMPVMDQTMLMGVISFTTWQNRGG